MSSSCGLTEIVLEGEAANDVYALLSRAKEECASEADYIGETNDTEGKYFTLEESGGRSEERRKA